MVIVNGDHSTEAFIVVKKAALCAANADADHPNYVFARLLFNQLDIANCPHAADVSFAICHRTEFAFDSWDSVLVDIFEKTGYPGVMDHKEASTDGTFAVLYTVEEALKIRKVMLRKAYARAGCAACGSPNPHWKYNAELESAFEYVFVCNKQCQKRHWKWLKVYTKGSSPT